jgi:hypothetical protein
MDTIFPAVGTDNIVVLLPTVKKFRRISSLLRPLVSIIDKKSASVNYNQTLEITSLQERHPNVGSNMRKTRGIQTVYRLVGAIKIPEDKLSEKIEVDLIRKNGNGASELITLSIGWSGTDDLNVDLPQEINNRNDKTTTEDAAIVVMALLINELEKASIISCIPIGGGPDYDIEIKDIEGIFKIEVSGIHIEKSYESSSRLAEKNRAY